MSVRVINIKPEYEMILGFLFPTYAITDSAAVTSRFITHRTVKSKAEREVLDLHYNDGVFISSQIFDELWDEVKIKQECIDFSRRAFKSRKKTVVTSPDTFIRDCVNFLFGIPTLEDEAPIIDLFETFGSSMFPVKFFKLSEEIPYQQLVAAMITFVSKIKKDSTSVFYKKKGLLLEDKINSNMGNALDLFNDSVQDGQGVSECKLFLNLVK